MSETYRALNETHFTKLITTNKYIKDKYLYFLTFSNFEDLNNINPSSLVKDTLTDYDFMTDFSLNLLEIKTKHFLKKKTSVFDQIGNSAKTSLFSLNLDEEEKSQEDKNLEKILKNYFSVLDLDNNKLLTFEEFMVFVKYIQAYDNLNKNGIESKGTFSTSSVNSNVI